jgi:lipopolysaccharide assembly outer membrane protein LptD (OstA)
MGVLTTEKDGYIHGRKVLRDSFEHIYVRNAKFTTCNLPDPHFHIEANKIKVIPKKQIVTGPANLVIEDINTPLYIPFGFFPIPEKRGHGVIFPTFGESPDRGFYFRGLGYYIPLSDYMDLKVAGDFYFRGSWGVSAQSSYYKRYKYRGNFGLSYNQNRTGEKELENYSVSNDVRINWTYNQDAKARPGSNFGASVNFVTSNYLRNNTTNYSDIIKTTSTSSISYSKSLLNNKLNLSLNSNIYQNLSTKDVNLTLPQLTASVSRQLPFKRALVSQPTLRSFIRNLGVSYTGNFRNEVEVKEETLFTKELLDSFDNGISHSIPIATSFKALRWLTVSPSFTFTDYWYLRTIEKQWNEEDSVVDIHDVEGFSRAHQFNFNVGVSTILYGQANFKNSKIAAVRHVIRPRISYAYNPDFSTGQGNGYRFVQSDTSGNVQEYSIYERGILGRPGKGSQSSINMSIGNNFEMKMRSKNDSGELEMKKVKLIERLDLSTGYNFRADSLHMRKISLTANTTLFKKIRINLSSSLDPYDQDSSGGVTRRVNRFLVNTSRKWVHIERTTLAISTSLNPDAFKAKTGKNLNERELEHINNNLDDYVDFNIPWNLTVNYNLNANYYFFKEHVVRQDLNFYGDVNLTKNWKIGFRSGYSITNREIALTSFDFYRNLHCWEMRFSWYPNIRRQFEFTIRVKSSTLQDLKLNRRRSWFDN